MAAWVRQARIIGETPTLRGATGETPSVRQLEACAPTTGGTFGVEPHLDAYQ